MSIKRYAMALDLVDDPKMIAEYEDHHRRVSAEIKNGKLKHKIDKFLFI